MRIFSLIKHWLTTPQNHGVDPKNFSNVQIDAIGVGLGNAASPFLPVFLTRLGAETIQIGLLTSMPGLAGLLTAIPLGRFLQNRKNIVPWFSSARLAVILSYALTSIATFIFKDKVTIYAVLVIWALATIPQTIVAISFSVVMNAVAGPSGRYELMSRRWSIMGVTTATCAFLVGLLLENVRFPLNYQLAFFTLSLGAFISYYFSSQDQDRGSGNSTAHPLFCETANRCISGIIAGAEVFCQFCVKTFSLFFRVVLRHSVITTLFRAGGKSVRRMDCSNYHDTDSSNDIGLFYLDKTIKDLGIKICNFGFNIWCCHLPHIRSINPPGLDNCHIGRYRWNIFRRTKPCLF